MGENYPSIFVDSSAWIALNEKKDTHHKDAKRFTESNRRGDLNFGPIHTSEMILQETYTFLRYNYNYAAAVDIVEKILNSNVIIHPFNSLEFEEIWKRIKNGKNQLSFVDWSTVGYMDDYNIKHVFTFDGDFEEIGYNALP
ncbi:MAG: type II toxin-antitoxin system VapC family toxin [Thermoplasmata archaeon]